MGHSHRDAPHTSVKMRRQDSGYESHIGSARTSMSQSRSPPPSRRVSNASSTAAASSSRTRTRPSVNRATRSYSHSNPPSSYHSRGAAGAKPLVYFQFPTPDLVELTETPSRTDQQSVCHPPQTTHYWTSDSTRRLEYEAIDAASRGVKGWFRRHLVPDCFTPRHVAFDDDSGSVRRYRLELEEDDHEKTRCSDGKGRGKGWWSVKKTNTL